MNPKKREGADEVDEVDEVSEALAKVPSPYLPVIREAIETHRVVRNMRHESFIKPRQIGGAMIVRYDDERYLKLTIQRMYGVILSLQTNGRDDLVAPYLELIRNAPKIRYYHHLKPDLNPLHAPSVMDELSAALSDPVFSAEMLEMLKVFASDRHYTNGSCLDSKESSFSVPAHIRAWREAGLEDDKIRALLRVLPENSWLAEASGTDFLEHYLTIEDYYPDGAKAMLKDLSPLQQCPRGIRHMLVRAKTGDFPREVREFMKIGHDMAQRLGDSANGFFKNDTSFDRMIRACDMRIPMRIELAGRRRRSDNLEDLRQAAHQAADFALQLPDHSDYEEDVRAVAFEMHLNYAGEKNAKAIHQCLQAVVDYAGPELKDEPQPDGNETRAIKVARTLKLIDIYFGCTRKNINKMAATITKLKFNISGESAHAYLSYIVKGHHPDLAALLTALDCSDERICQLLEVKMPKALEPLIKLGKLLNQDKPEDQPENPYELDAWIEEAERAKDFFTNKEMRSKIEGVIQKNKERKNMLFFKMMLSQAVISPDGKVIELSSFLKEANPSTQMAVAGSSLLVSIGAMHLPGISERLEPLPPQKNYSNPDLLGHLLERYFDVVRRNMAVVAPLLEEKILAARRQSIGLMPIGGKIHTSMPMDEKLVDFMSEVFGFSQTSFKMIHANESLLLPPVLTAYELKLLIRMLASVGVWDKLHPDLQLAVGGRWNHENVSMAGGSMLLATQAGGTYRPGTFGTSHNHLTGACIMAYDDGVKQEGMPGDLMGANGRTDVLGRQAESDIPLYQNLGTWAAHLEYGGFFESLGGKYRDKFHRILDQHGLRDALDMSAWVSQHRWQGDSPERHEEMVNTFGRAWLAAYARHQNGEGLTGTAVGDTAKLIRQTITQMHAERSRILLTDRAEVERVMSY